MSGNTDNSNRKRISPQKARLKKARRTWYYSRNKNDLWRSCWRLWGGYV